MYYIPYKTGHVAQRHRTKAGVTYRVSDTGMLLCLRATGRLSDILETHEHEGLPARASAPRTN